MILTRDAILKAKVNITSVEVPGWEGTVLFRPLSVAGLSDFMEQREKLTAYQLYPLLIVLSLCDENGEYIFTQDDFEELAKQPFATLKTIGDEILKLNGLADKSADPEKKVSQSVPTSSDNFPLLSGSASQSPS
jgi:hypothetical protein